MAAENVRFYHIMALFNAPRSLKHRVSAFPTLPGETTIFVEDVIAGRLGHVSSKWHPTTADEHGRVETRMYGITSDIECLGGTASWANIHSVRLVESRREGGDAVALEQRLFLTSLP